MVQHPTIHHTSFSFKWNTNQRIPVTISCVWIVRCKRECLWLTHGDFTLPPNRHDVHGQRTTVCTQMDYVICISFSYFVFLAWNKFRWSMFLYSFAALNIFAIVVISLHYAIMYRFVIIWNVWVWVSARLDCLYVVSCFRGLATMSTGNELRSLSHSDIMFIKLECALNVHTVKWRHADMYQMCVCVSFVRSFKVQPMILEKRKRKYVFIDFYPCHSVECNFLIYLQI